LEKKNDGVMDDKSGDAIMEEWWIRKRQIKTWLTKWARKLRY